MFRFIKLSIPASLMFALLAISAYAANSVPGTLVTYTYQHELLPKGNSEPLLTVYSDGSMKAVFPVYMKRAGTYQGQLSDEQLQALKSLISAPEIVGYSAKKLSEEIALREAQQEQIEGKGKTYFAVMDSTTTIIELSTAPSGSSNETIGKSATKKIEQKDLSVTAKQHPDIPMLQKTQKLRIMLQNILDTSDWTKVGDNS